MGYLAYWNLHRSPFSLRHSGADYFVSGSIAEAYARIDFLIHHGRRFGILFGTQGVGKSAFFRHLMRSRSRFPRETVRLVDLAGVTPALLTQRFRDVFLGETSPEECLPDRLDSASLSLGRRIQEIDELATASASLGRQGILLLDNAESALEESLETLSMLLKRPGKWTAILGVDESLLVNLPRKILESCELRIDLPAWDLSLTTEYFQDALASCGTREDIFEMPAIARIHELSEGIPRRILQLADMALVFGSAKRMAAVDAELVHEIFDEFSISLAPRGFQAAAREEW